MLNISNIAPVHTNIVPWIAYGVAGIDGSGDVNLAAGNKRKQSRN